MLHNFFFNREQFAEGVLCVKDYYFLSRNHENLEDDLSFVWEFERERYLIVIYMLAALLFKRPFLDN